MKFGREFRWEKGPEPVWGSLTAGQSRDAFTETVFKPVIQPKCRIPLVCAFAMSVRPSVPSSEERSDFYRKKSRWESYPQPHVFSCTPRIVSEPYASPKPWSLRLPDVSLEVPLFKSFPLSREKRRRLFSPLEKELVRGTQPPDLVLNNENSRHELMNFVSRSLSRWSRIERYWLDKGDCKDLARVWHAIHTVGWRNHNLLFVGRHILQRDCHKGIVYNRTYRP